MAILVLNTRSPKGASRGFRVKSLVFSNIFMSKASKTRGFGVNFKGLVLTAQSIMLEKFRVQNLGFKVKALGSATNR